MNKIQRIIILFVPYLVDLEKGGLENALI